MGIRRRRRKLTTLMSRLDQRVRSVELRPINLLTSSEVANAVEIGQPLVGPETAVSASAPWQFIKVQDGYVYPKALTGNTDDRVELYTEADIGAAVGDRVEVSGVHWASSSQMDVTGDNFIITNIDTSADWSGRPSYKHDPTQGQLSGVTITHAYELVPESVAPQTWTSRRRLQTRRKVDSFEITAAPGSTVTLTMNATHHFEVGDIIFVDIFAEDSRAYGVDGLFEITAVSSNTIEYVLTAGVDTAVGSTDVSSADVYVHPVIREWAQDGSIWVDSSNNETYYWDGIRWVDYTPGAVAGDGNPPAAPTNLNITSNINFIIGNTARVIVEVGWTAPTTNSDGSTLTDLFGYLIKWRAGSGDWKTYRLEDATATSVTFGEAGLFADNTAYSFEVYAFDSGGEYSSALTGTHTTADAPDTNIATVRPTPLTPSVYLGTITLVWDGDVENTSGVTQTKPDGLIYLDIHRSTTDGFTPSTSTLVTSITAVAGAKYVDASVTYGNSYYYRAILRDASNTSSLPSQQVTGQATSLVDVAAIQGIIQAANITPGTIVTGEDIIGINITGQLIRGDEINGNIIKANSIEANKMDVGSLAARFLSSDVISTNATDSGSRVRMTTSGLEAYNGSTRTIFINSANGSIDIASGSLTIGGSSPATQSDLSSFLTSSDLAPYLTSSLAASTYATLSSLGLYLTASDASNTYVTAVTAGTLYIAKGDAASDINDNATTIDGGKITTNSINVNRLIAGTITAFRIQTASSGKRILLSETTNRIVMYDSNGNTSGFIEGNLAGLQMSNGAGDLFLSMFANSIVMESSSLTYFKVDQSVAKTTIYYPRMPILAGTGLRYVGADADGDIQIISSDERVKKNINSVPLGLDFIKSLNPIEYNWIYEDDSVGKEFGLVAQELSTALTSSGFTNSEKLVFEMQPSDKHLEYLGDSPPSSIYGINYPNLISPMIKAIQELSETVASLEARVAALEGN